MSWIFEEPFQLAIYARRRVAPPAPALSAASSTRTRRIAAIIVADVFGAGPWTAQRRIFAPVGAVTGPLRSYTPARRVLAHLIAGGAYDETSVAYRLYPFTRGYPAPGPDGGRSASFSVTFTGQGDDPYGPIGISAGPGLALGADTFRELAVQNLAVFGGTSASRTV